MKPDQNAPKANADFPKEDVDNQKPPEENVSQNERQPSKRQTFTARFDRVPRGVKVGTLLAVLGVLLLLPANTLLSPRETRPDPSPQPSVADLTPAPTERPTPHPTAPPRPTPIPTPVPTPTPTPILSRLTGLPIAETDERRRPAAVVINNLYPAHPQSGLAGADLIYEALAEGEITRLIAFFQSFEGVGKIGPVRSARDYFVDFALDYDAIFVHHGGSPSGYARLNGLGINRLDGITLEGLYFWRDRNYPAWHPRAGQRRSLEHSSYISAQYIREASAKMGFREYWDEGANYGFRFSTPDGTAISGAPSGNRAKETDAAAVPSAPPDEPGVTPVASAPAGESVNTSSVPASADESDAAPAATVRVFFSRDYIRAFAYFPDTGLYAVANRDGEHMDAETAEQLTVTNILIQNVSMRIVPGDAEGRREAGTLGAGGGWLINGGVARAVRWERPDRGTPTVWTFADGAPMTLQPGKTWVCVFQENGEMMME